MEPLTPFDVGFELASEPKLEPNYYNVGGNKCKTCPIATTCLLARRHYESMCFEGLQKDLVQTDVCKKALNKERLSKEDAALHLYVDSMLYHLEKLPDPKTAPLDLFTLWDIRTDIAVDVTNHGDLCMKYAARARMFGRLTIEILRDRGYEI